MLAVGAAVGVYFGLRGILGQETASWACMVAAAPVAVTGFFHYNGLTFEQFLWAFMKSALLCSNRRVFKADNLYCKILDKKGVRHYD